MKKIYLFVILTMFLFEGVAQTFSKVLISNNQSAGAFGLIEYDVNSDGVFDLIGTAKNDNAVMYFINDGSGNFTQHIIDNNLPGAAFAFAGDLDGDTDLDFVAVGSSEMRWYENDGSFGFTSHLIDNLTDPSFVGIYDADGDGDNDIGVAITGENYITAYLNGGSANFSRINAISINSPKMFYGGDFNGDGTADILAPSYTDNKIEWYTFNGLWFALGGSVVTNFNGAWGAEGVDMDGDGDYDVVAAAYDDNTIAWFENDGSGANFTRHDVDTQMNHAMYTRTFDFDSDGDKDIVATANGTNGAGSEVVLFVNDGNQNFTKQVLDNTTQGPAWFAVQDFTGDGFYDVAFASNVSNEFNLLIQQTSFVNNQDKADFVVYPNPADRQIFVKAEKKFEKLVLFDLTGRKLSESFTNRLNLDKFTSGTYLLKVVFANGIIGTKKLIIN